MSTSVPAALLEKQNEQVSRVLMEQVESVVSDYAARGFPEIPGPAIAQMLEAGASAMQSLYTAALSIAPSVVPADASGFVAAFDSALNSLSLAAMSRAQDGASPQLDAKREQLVHQLRQRLG